MFKPTLKVGTEPRTTVRFPRQLYGRNEGYHFPIAWTGFGTDGWR